MHLAEIFDHACKKGYQRKGNRLKYPQSKNYNLVLSESGGKILFQDFTGKQSVHDFAEDIELKVADFFLASNDYDKNTYVQQKTQRQLEDELIHAYHFLTLIDADMEAGKPASISDIAQAEQYVKFLKKHNFNRDVYNSVSRERALDLIADHWLKLSIEGKHGEGATKWVL